MSTTRQFDKDQVVNTVEKWIHNVIIGLNFCPFAKKEMERKTVRYNVSATTQVNDALSCLLDEVALLEQQPELQTSLIIFPCGFTTFDQYLALLNLAEVLINQGGYSGIYQLASFHPDYCFDDAELDDPANYTNRSPYPILHILRESSVEAVLKRYPNPESIPENNINKARHLGTKFLHKLLNN
jgi:hypothetical protein